jgi:hypothetical protein
LLDGPVQAGIRWFPKLEGDGLMMNALIVAALCSVVLASAPSAARAYVYARKKDARAHRRRNYD